jgi:hypothetical protein
MALHCGVTQVRDPMPAPLRRATSSMLPRAQLQTSFDEQIVWRKTLDKYLVEIQRVGPNWPRLVIGGASVPLSSLRNNRTNRRQKTSRSAL